MSVGIQFSLGMDAGDFVRGVTQSEESLKRFNQAAHDAGGRMKESGAEMLGMREKVEIARHSLDSMGGSFGQLGGLARLALDPMTIGFAALFAAVEFVNKKLEESAKRMEEFAKKGIEVQKIVKDIVAARPTATEEWMAGVRKAAEVAHPAANLNFFADQSQDVAKEGNKNTADAAQAAIELEQKKVELLRDQGRISAADAAKRIEALKDQAVLQKNLSEQIAIKSELNGRKSDLAEIQKQAAANPISSAFEKKQEADARVADLQKQLEDLPKAIAGEKLQAADAAGKAKGTYLDASERGQWTDQRDQANSRAAQLQAQLDKARGEFTGAANEQAAAGAGYENAQGYQKRGVELREQVAALTNKQSSVADRQRKMTPYEMEKNRIEAEAAATKGQTTDKYKKSDGTALEKMGFVMGGGGSPMKETNDILRQMLAQQRAQKAEAQMNQIPAPANAV